jgi:hypothetical protein
MLERFEHAVGLDVAGERIFPMLDRTTSKGT